MSKPSTGIGRPWLPTRLDGRGLRRQFTRWGAGVGFPMLTLVQLRAEDQAGYRYEFYQEDNNRIQVGTDTVLVQKILAPWLDLKVTGTHDAISGATPVGMPPADSYTLHPTGTSLSIPGTSITSFQRTAGVNGISGASPSSSPTPTSISSVPVGTIKDTRWAFDVSPSLIFGPHRLTPEFSYSTERDYLSYSGALNYALDLNQKNTTLKAGWSHSADTILAVTETYLSQDEYKNSNDFLLGVTQLLGPKTILDFNVGLGFVRGYLDDPYRSVIFEGEHPSANNTVAIYGEKRPGSRDQQTAEVRLTQAVSPLDASVVASYRYYHDSFDIHAHTVNLAWNQKVGSFLVLSPSFRYDWQTAASFYGTIFPGDPVTDPQAVPAYYSSDFRLSNMETFTVGIQATIKVRDWLGLDLGYQRYLMYGLDGVTSQSAYPSANVFTIGARVWF